METSNLVAMLLSFGLTGVGFLAMFEKLCPIPPSYVMLLFFGMTIVSDMRTLILATAATVVGSTVGALCWYGVGRLIGPCRIEGWIARHGRYLLVSPALYQRLADAYRRNHFGVTLVGQVIPTVRIYIAIPAGVLRLHLPTFILATSIGSLAWNLPLLSLGFGLRHGGYEPATVGLSVVGGLIAMELVIFLWLRFRPKTRRWLFL